MKQGTIWTEVNVWHDEDEPTTYRIKIKYEYESGGWNEGYRVDPHIEVDIIEFPENLTEQTKKMIRTNLSDKIDDIFSDPDVSEYDFDDYWEARYEERINNEIDNQKEQ